MVFKKKKIVVQEEPKKKRVTLNLKEYQKAIKRAREPEVIQRLQKIYQASEESRQAKKATSIAKQASRGYVGNVLSGYRRSSGEKNYEIKARKLINLISPKGSITKSLTYGGGVNRGRGRPLKTYKPRFVPGVGYVRVPTAVYNKMISEWKTRQRLLQAQQSSLAEQQAMQTDARFQTALNDEQFLEEPELQSESTVQQYPIQQNPQIYTQEPLQQQNQPNLMQRFTQGFSNFGRTPRPQSGQFQQPNPFYNPPTTKLYGSGVPQQQFNPQIQPLKSEPRVTVISDKANLLNVPSQFDKPGNAQILFKGQREF